MSKRMLNLSIAAMLAMGVVAASNMASATPSAGALAIGKAPGSAVETVRWGRGFGWGFGAGFLGGAIIGGALASPYYYGGPYYYGAPYYPPAAYGPDYYPAPGYGGDAAYCASRYRSYDPATGTFLGYDGVRHPCP
jgi:BA14K-like protein